MSKKIAIVATDYFEEPELFEPLRTLQAAGFTVEIVAPHDGTIKGLRHVEPGEAATVDNTFDAANPGEYDAVVLPGGVVNADNIRMNKRAQSFVNDLMVAGKPVAAICHAPWLLVSAGLVRGKTLTSWPSLQDDIRNAGGSWVDEEVHIDGNLITSRKPDDIPAFVDALIRALSPSS